ncbi:MAG: DUF6516 family protein [Caldilinea sp.]|nr:hypothetical protein [Caldilinea sp.]MCB0149388.1 hypothetical protein [Caldilineaceae bacterium]MCB0042554.1 hypothetical protein [Caldilinea sp.]MCB0049998.1 hypothetical protein [Caldilinea sp.]MCB9116213.1 hypothetical protein [Caldilineaceae bacterium]
MIEPASYVAEIELALVSSPVLENFHVLRVWTNSDDGYLRLRATLVNGDFLEAAEYFVLDVEAIKTVDYRHQWMDGARKVLRRRWDSTPDHPELGNFPYHVHVVDEQDVQPDKPMSILELLKWFEAHFQELSD